MKNLLAIAFAATIAASASAQLWSQGPHTPGATGGDGMSTFYGTLDAGASLHDRQFADDFLVDGPGWIVNSVSAHYVKFDPNDPNPLTGMNVSFFEKTGAGGVGALVASAMNVSVSTSAGPGTYFTRPELIGTADFDPIVLNPGEYFVKIQPVVDHNFFWLTSTPDNQWGSFAHYRVGPDSTNAADNASWPTDWTATGVGAPFANAHDVAFSIDGEPVPEPATMLALGAGLAALAARRRKNAKS